MLDDKRDYTDYFKLQEAMRSLVIMEDKYSNIKHVAGVDVAYNEENQTMVGGIVILDFKKLKVVESKFHKMQITFPYVPGLFSFREIPAIKEAYNKLNTKPDIVICDAQGIAHPKGVGMATHLGIELDIPTIGCAKKRLFGEYNEENLGLNKGDFEYLRNKDEKIGVVLRTQDKIKPMFVSIGHKVSLNSAINIINHLTPKYRLPETTREGDQLVNSLMKNI